MKIISKFKESYDYMLSHGIDENLVYERHTSFVDISFSKCFSSNDIFMYQRIARMVLQHNEDYKLCFIVIDDNVFPLVTRFDKSKISSERIVFDKNEMYEDFKDFENNVKGRHQKSSNKYQYVWFEKVKKLKPFKNKKIAKEAGSPVCAIIVNTKTVVVNPKLDDVGGYRFMDGFNIFQSISRFLSEQKEVESHNAINISDSDLKNAKGFYDYSFKTRPKK